MAVVVSFQDRILDLTGPLITTDDDAIQQWILDGCYDVVMRLRESGQLNIAEFVVAGSDITTGAGIDTDNIRQVAIVERNGLPCRRVNQLLRSYVSNANSIYEASSDDPVYFHSNNKVFIKPDSTTNEVGVIYTIPEYAITAFAGTSSIDNFPVSYYEHVVLYAAIQTLARQLLDLTNNTAGTNSLSMDVIKNLFNNNLPSSGKDVLDLLDDEDTELVGTTLSAMQAATALTKTKYEWYANRMAGLAQDYMGKFSSPKPKGSK
jgi:hypothetical protein